MTAIRDVEKDARSVVKDVVDNPGYWGDPEEDDDGEVVEACYLGSVFSLTPSGKYYMPWACSNVEPCKRCKGEGCDFCGGLGSREAYEDECWRDELENAAMKNHCWVFSGEGDPCDLFLGREVGNE